MALDHLYERDQPFNSQVPLSAPTSVCPTIPAGPVPLATTTLDMRARFIDRQNLLRLERPWPTRGGLIKVIWHDGQGACLFSKKLERGRFIWPTPADAAVTISPAQMGYLLEGIDWRAPQKTWRPELAG